MIASPMRRMGAFMARKKRKRQGHFCWSCQGYLPNERFSGRGHRNHLCKKCSALGKEELEYRQAVRDIDRCLDWDGRLKRRQGKAFERFRDHANPRVRSYVEKVEEHWAEQRRVLREMREQHEADEEEIEKMLAMREDERSGSAERECTS